ncbi:MAG: UDP-N-acetylglucosamine-1-phosphate transferase [Candidatus Altiarchaeota archaeon]|nr:UDP-N-acetylglucosamine-1-phosphate transferase [Candidatus Altiarchaeota archaeon]
MDGLLEALAALEEHYRIIVIFLTGLATTFIYTPKLIHKAFERKHVVKDMYKKGRPHVPNLGGLAILAGVFVSLISAQFLLEHSLSHEILIFYFMVFSFALFGLMDDLLDVGRKSKILIPFFLALPISILLDPGAGINIGPAAFAGIAYFLVIAPVYVMVVSNLINMHSGFNGLSCGLSYMLLVFTIIKVMMNDATGNIVYILPLFGSILAFLYFETYPARIFWGNVGSLMVGSAVGGFIVLNNLELFGIVILIPHIINFLMYVVWKIKKLGDVKFGGLRADGTLIVPNPLTLKWLFPYYFRLTEHQTMWIMYAVTVFFGVVGLVAVP